MKIAQKLTLLFIGGTSAVLACNGYFRVRREVTLFESDRAQNQDLMASAIAAAAGAVWRTDGGDRARELVGQLDQRTPKLSIAWLSLDDPTSLDASTTARLRNGSVASLVATGANREKSRCTYAPVTASGATVGAVGVCEALAVQQRYVRRTILETFATTVALAAVCALISAALGFWLVDRPIRALMNKARRIGEGDFSRPLVPRGNDELASLSVEMNAMCDRLARAAARVEAETRSRIATLEQLRHADRLMTVGKLASGLAHELGTPLNVIEARAEMIASGDTDHDDTIAYANVITEATERMTRIVRQLLDFARRGRSQAVPHDVLSLARRTIELLTP
ncbi:MAG: HAMP domain-containing protein, partial [Polyangiaceae bacterium]